MKRNHLLLVLLAFMVVGVTLALRLWPRTLPESQCSPVYRRYAQVSGIEASFVKNFPLNDTLAVDVTLLQATTDPAWQRLREDFGVKQLNDTVERINGSKATTCRYAPKQDYSLPMDTTSSINNDLLLISRSEMAIGIFHIYSSWQIDAIKKWQIDAMINNTPIITINNEEQNN